jgi:hypothetical protein
MSYWYFLWVGNLIADKGDPDGRNVQTGLADQIRPIPCISYASYYFQFPKP